MKIKEIRIRDPFVYSDKVNKKYYVYGTTELKEGLNAGNKFSVYVSKDLENFDGPFVVFEGTDNFWGTKDFWASEVHFYKGKYYLIGSFFADNHRRASQILVSDSLLGKFKPISRFPQTPIDWDCLDGTLYIENNKPYLIFCHEWTQCEVGEIWAEELSDDLSKVVGKPFLLFKASDNKFVTSFRERGMANCMVTDGPFVVKENSKMKIFWSSFVKGRYVVLEAVADNIYSRWEHFPPRFDFEGGHAMIFEDFEGKKFFSLHSPNIPEKERMCFIKYNEKV